MWRCLPLHLYVCQNFYSHIPCGMWPATMGTTVDKIGFLLTHPVWDVTAMLFFMMVLDVISTHTSRVGCDSFSIISSSISNHFYSHIPCGMWLQCSRYRFKLAQFLLTHPVWDVTELISPWAIFWIFLLTHPVWDVTVQACPKGILPRVFLLTHPVWDVTQKVLCTICFQRNFYSHIPCGMWPFLLELYIISNSISTHTSRVGCDNGLPDKVWNTGISTHTSRVGCDPYAYQIFPLFPISTHTSRVGCDKDACPSIFMPFVFLLTHPVWDVTDTRRTC